MDGEGERKILRTIIQVWYRIWRYSYCYEDQVKEIDQRFYNEYSTEKEIERLGETIGRQIHGMLIETKQAAME